MEGRIMDAAGLLAHEARLEDYLRAAEALAAHRDGVAIRQLAGLSSLSELSVAGFISVSKSSAM